MNSTRVTLAALLAAAVQLAALPSSAHAEEPATSEASSSYGEQILVADLAAFGIGAATAWGANDMAGVYVGLGTFSLAAPVLHIYHGHPWRGLGDLVLRFGVPSAVGVVVLTRCDIEDPSKQGPQRFSCEEKGVIAMAASGLVIGIVDALLAPSDARDRKPSAVQLGLAPHDGGFSLSLGGTF